MGKVLLHKRSSIVTNGSAKLPQPNQLEHGELAINFASGDETISLKNTVNDIATFKTYEKTVSGVAASVEYDTNEKKIFFYDKFNNKLPSSINASLLPSGLPEVTTDNNGMVLKVVNGAWQVVSAVTVYSGTGEPESTLGHNGDIFLKV
jgi:hypothetical protein